MASDSSTALVEVLTGLGFEDLGNAMFRGFVSISGTNVLQPVFISLEEAATVSLMSPLGEVAEMDVEVLTAARDAADGYSVTSIGSHSVGLTRKISNETAREDSSRFVAAAVAIAEYTALVKSRIAEQRDTTQALLARMNGLIDPDNWHAVDSGQVSVESFLSDADSLLRQFPNHGMWNAITGAASRAALWCWANGGQDRQLAGSPWSQVANKLKQFGNARGWELSTDD